MSSQKTKIKTSSKKKKSFNNYLSNKKNWFYKTSYKDNNSKKKRKICFQLISQDKVEINPNFYMPAPLLTIIKNNHGSYNPEAKAYQIGFKNYSFLYKDLDKFLQDEKSKKLPELNSICLEPIPLLPLEVASKAKTISILKFKSVASIKNNKKSYQQITLDFTKDAEKSLNFLPEIFLKVLYPFQKEGIKFGIERKGRILLADEMGVGKSIQAIGISLLYKENWPVLIICPSSLKLVWRDEILKWLPDIKRDDLQIFKSGKEEFKAGKKYYIISYDLTIKIEQAIIDKKFNFIIADEAHYLKSPDAKRTKCLVPIIQKSKRILLLTGTPILSKPVELYTLLTMLRPDLFYNFKVFGNRYCDPKQNFFGIDWTGSSCAKELNYILKNIMIRRLKKDVISELPPKKRQKVEIATDSKIIKQILAINICTDDLFNKLNELNNAAFNGNSQKIDLIEDDINNDENGNILNLFSKVYLLSAEAKAQGVKDYIHYLIDNKCKFLIFGHHQIMLDAIEEEVKKLKVDYIRIDGKVKLEKRQEYVNKFQSDETCLVAILSITACYTGITLTAASTVVFSELHMTPAVMIQAEDRAHRIGQEHESVNIHYLYGPDTLDEILFKMLNQKQNIFSNTLDNTSANMDVRYTFKKVGDFEKGKTDLDVNINNKKVVVTENGIKNMTLNNFITFNNNNSNTEKNKINENNNKEIDEKLSNINLHKNQNRLNNPDIDDEFCEEILDNINDTVDIDNNDDDNTKNDTKEIILQKNNKNKIIEDDDDNNNKQTKDKNKKKKKSNKNEGKMIFRTISDYFK